MNEQKKPNFTSLLPFLIFIITFLGAGIYFNDFYAFPAPLAVLLGVIVALIIYKDSVNEKMDTFIKGCGDSKIITMCIIYLLAGGFATVTAAMGGVDAIVNFGLEFINSNFLALGVFVIAAFLSTASGTSVGCIVALGPIVVGMADKSGASLALLSGTLLGGAMFGDNLSMISDTTIAATQSLGCDMKDKFKVNLFIALPAAVLTIVLLVWFGAQTNLDYVVQVDPYNLIKIIPYILIIILAVSGLNVYITLMLGILISGGIGLFYEDFSSLVFFQKIYEGFTSMTEIFLLSMFAGGLAALVTKAGGIQYILNAVKKGIKGKKTAELGIAAIVSTVDAAIANNTVAIVVTGDVAKSITEEYELNNKKTATVMDIFACIMQGLLPYGAQVLFLLKYADNKISYLELVANAHYLYILLGVTLLTIFIQPLQNLINKHFKSTTYKDL
ncbi:MAG: Na+/H+ antiporter NhaC family protein [Flavobacterium sp.]|nr:Na+/H+ antiporter NhaC family protein [Candidatus Neoflavobacterium equi]